jgi:inorganic pyrophosphatase
MDYFEEAAKWFTEAEHLFFKDDVQAKQLFCSGMKNLAYALRDIKHSIEKMDKEQK